MSHENQQNDLLTKEFLTLDDVAKLLTISRSTVYRLRREGVLKEWQVGNKKYITRKSIDQLFESEL